MELDISQVNHHGVLPRPLANGKDKIRWLIRERHNILHKQHWTGHGRPSQRINQRPLRNSPKNSTADIKRAPVLDVGPSGYADAYRETVSDNGGPRPTVAYATNGRIVYAEMVVLYCERECACASM